MSSNPNVLTHMRAAELPCASVEPGDVALLLKKDGSVQALNFGYDRTRLLLPSEQMTDDDRAMQKQGQKLFALALAAQHPQIMSILLDIACDPDVVDFAKLEQMMRVH